MDEYVDDDFESNADESNSENDFAKVSVSQSGRLPPLSAANPIGTMGVNRSQSSVTDKDPNRLSTKFKDSAARTSNGGNVNLADSGDNIVDFDLSESKYTSHQIPIKIDNETPRTG